MAKLPLMTASEFTKVLKKLGFEFKRQQGSHMFFEHPDGRTTIVPVHTNKDIGKGLLKAILDEIQMDREEFFGKYN